MVVHIAGWRKVKLVMFRLIRLTSTGPSTLRKVFSAFSRSKSTDVQPSLRLNRTCLTPHCRKGTASTTWSVQCLADLALAPSTTSSKSWRCVAWLTILQCDTQPEKGNAAHQCLDILNISRYIRRNINATTAFLMWTVVFFSSFWNTARKGDNVSFTVLGLDSDWFDHMRTELNWWHVSVGRERRVWDEVRDQLWAVRWFVVRQQDGRHQGQELRQVPHSQLVRTGSLRRSAARQVWEGTWTSVISFEICPMALLSLFWRIWLKFEGYRCTVIMLCSRSVSQDISESNLQNYFHVVKNPVLSFTMWRSILFAFWNVVYRSCCSHRWKLSTFSAETVITSSFTKPNSRLNICSSRTGMRVDRSVRTLCKITLSYSFNSVLSSLNVDFFII